MNTEDDQDLTQDLRLFQLKTEANIKLSFLGGNLYFKKDLQASFSFWEEQRFVHWLADSKYRRPGTQEIAPL